MTDAPSTPNETARKPARRPGPGAVIWGSVALFAILFAVLTYQLGSSLAGTATASRPTLVRKIVKRKVVTTVVPGAGGSSVAAGPATMASESSSAAEPITTGAS